MSTKVVTPPVSVNFEKISACGEKSAGQAGACAHSGSSGKAPEWKMAVYEIRPLTRAGERRRGPSAGGWNPMPDSSHDSAQTMESQGGKSWAQGQAPGESLRQLPEGLGIAATVCVFCRLRFTRNYDSLSICSLLIIWYWCSIVFSTHWMFFSFKSTLLRCNVIQ